MGGTLWELSKLMIFMKKIIKNQSFGELLFFEIFNDQLKP